MSTTAKPMARKAAPWVAAATLFVGGWEGMQRVSYRDVIGVPTICYGETRGVKMGQTATKEECDQMLADGLLDFAEGVRKQMPGFDTMPPSRQVAVVSLAYNIGLGNFAKSSVRRELNAGNVRAGCEAFMKWNKAGGIVFRGLTRRRDAERKLCLEGPG
ncbi:MAG TPA: lysozyme [Opitutaceae bacterium]|nr:lysozyme [Opitutaceae bacterium]